MVYVAEALSLSYLANRSARSASFTIIGIKDKVVDSLSRVLSGVLLLSDICRLIIPFTSLYLSRVVLRTYKIPSFLK